jgi:hypothetical protein
MSGPTQEAELKQQGAIEAAMAAPSQGATDAAIKKVVTESKKAGVAAYEFDADASPEQKAAQMRNSLPEGVPTHQKTNATAIATDIDDGSAPKYDLPPPSKAGMIEVEKDADGKPLELPEDVKDITAKAGWAPKFGAPVPDADPEGALSRPTWVEGNLAEKFYGGKY